MALSSQEIQSLQQEYGNKGGAAPSPTSTSWADQIRNIDTSQSASVHPGVFNDIGVSSFGSGNTPQPGFVDSVKGDLSSRAKNVSDILGNFNKQSNFSTGYQIGGEAAGLVTDIFGEVLNKATGGLLKQAGTQIAQNVSQGKGLVGEFIQSPVGQKLSQGLSNWAKQHPEAAANLNATVNAAGAAGALSATQDVASKISQGISSLTSSPAKVAPYLKGMAPQNIEASLDTSITGSGIGADSNAILPKSEVQSIIRDVGMRLEHEATGTIPHVDVGGNKLSQYVMQKLGDGEYTRSSLQDAVSKILQPGSESAAKLLEPAAAADRNILDIVRPKLSTAEEASAKAAGRGTTTGGLFKTTGIAPSPAELEMAKYAQDAGVTSQNTFDQNIKLMKDAQVKSANEVRSGLEKSNAIWNQNQLKGVLDKVERPITLVGDTGKIAQRFKEAVLKLAETANKKTVGLLDVRQGLDRLIDEQLPSNIYFKNSPLGQYARSVRRALNDWTESQIPNGKLPSGATFKGELRRQHLLYDAIDNVAEKAPKIGESANPLIQKVSQFGKKHPLIKRGIKAGATIAGAGALVEAGKDIVP